MTRSGSSTAFWRRPRSSVSRSSAPPLRLATVRVPRVRPRTARGPLDDSAAGQSPPVAQVRALARQVGARGHVTLGGRLPADAKGFPARAMARTHAGDWRDPERVRGWAAEVAAALQAVGGGPGPGQGSRRPARPSR
jgi:hypothetical protein